MPNGTVKMVQHHKRIWGLLHPMMAEAMCSYISQLWSNQGLTGLSDNQKVSFDLAEGRDGRQMASDIAPL